MKRISFFFMAFVTMALMSSAVKAQNFNYHKDFKKYLDDSKKKSGNYYYPTLLERFEKNDSTLTNQDVMALMIGFTSDKNYKPYSIIEDEQEILQLVRDKKYEEAIKKSDKLLKTNPLNFIALMERSFSALKLDIKDQDFHKEKFMKILRCVLWSGDGSKSSPYFVLGPTDGQILIRYIWGNSMGTMGSGDDENGYFLDILEMQKEDKTSETMYFIIQHAVNRMFE